MKPLCKKLLPWLLGIVVATLFFAFLYCYAGFSYSGSDDAPILRSFMGYDGGVPAHYHLYLHTFLAWLLYGLATVFPGIAWFSILQLFLLWFGCVVLTKSLSKSAALRGLSPWMGALWGGLCLAVFALFIACRVSYTTTSALLGAAAIAQLLSIDFAHGKSAEILRGMSLSILLLMFCYSLRQISVLPPLAFWGLSLLLIWAMHYHAPKPQAAPVPQASPASKASPVSNAAPRKSPKPLLLGALICALCFSALAGVRAVEIKALNLTEYLAWQRARIQLFDYTDFSDNPSPEALKRLGWSQAKLTLVQSWFFMDESITTEALEILYEEQVKNVDRSLSGRLSASVTVLRDFFAVNPAYISACGLLAALGFFIFTGSLLRRKGAAPLLALASFLGLLLGGAMLFYLAFQGRLPLRAAVTAILPTAAFLFALLPMLYRPAPGRRGLQTIACVAVLVLAAVLGGESIQRTLPLFHPETNPDLQLITDTAGPDLDEYALAHPDTLFIRDLSQASNNLMFPDTSKGIPPNVILWGGYPAHSPSWNYQLARYGIDGDSMTARDFLRDNVLVAGTDGAPWDSLVAHIEEDAGASTDWDFYDQYGYVGFFEFYAYE